VLRAGFAVRTAAIAVLAAAFLSPLPGVTAALAGFVVLVLAWPLLGVSGTALAAETACGEKGEALGLFNASSALAGAAGAFLGGWVMETSGYGMVCLISALLVALATLFSGAGKARVQPPVKAA
jgi:predicted MFS family arabinose efflux permease